MQTEKHFLRFILSKSVFVLMAVFIFSACKKENTTPAPKGPVTIDGIWKGKYGEGTASPVFFYGFKIKPGGVFERISESGTVEATGTWSLSSTVFIGIYSKEGQQYSIAGTFNAEEGTIVGDWGFNANTSDGGTFHVKKQ